MLETSARRLTRYNSSDLTTKKDMDVYIEAIVSGEYHNILIFIKRVQKHSPRISLPPAAPCWHLAIA